MNKKLKKLIIPALAATIVGGGISIANAANIQDKPASAVQEENDGQNQAELAKQAKITQAEATKTALEKVPGKVNEVELEDENGTIVYGFEIAAEDGSKQDVKIDAQTGKIVKVEADDDNENGAEKDDGNEVE